MMDNPYDTKLPGNHYVGNVELREAIVHRMAHGGESFAVVGGRRCGKTSTIRVISRELEALNIRGRIFLPIEIGPGTFDKWSPGAVYGRIFQSLVCDLPSRVTDTICESRPYESFKERFRGVSSKLIQHYGPRWTAIILIDEIDGVKKELPRNTRFFANLRDLVSTGEWSAHFRLIVTGTNELGGLRSAGSPLKNVLARKELGIIDRKAVDELTAVGFKNGLPRDAAETLAALSGCHPYLVQGLLLELWFLSRKGTDSGPKDEISPLHVREAGDAFMGGYSSIFDDWTNSIGTLGCQIFGMMLVKRDDISPRELAKRLSKTPKEIDTAIGRLATHGVIDARVGDGLKVSGTLFADWFEGSVARPTLEVALVDLERTLEELDVCPTERKKIMAAISNARNSLEQGALNGEALKSAGEQLGTVANWISSIERVTSSAEKIGGIVIKALPYLGKAIGGP